MDPKDIIINGLMSDKDRLLTEKDELIASKDQLWRELYDMVQDKDKEIHEKDGEIIKLKETNNALKDALKEMLDREAEEELQEDNDGVEETITNDPTLDDAGYGRRFTDSLFVSPSPSETSQQISGMATTVSEADQRGFYFLPLIRVNEEGESEFGDFDKIDPSVVASIQSTLAELDKRHREGKKPRFPSSQFKRECCAWMWILATISKICWTVEHPRTFTCFACFNARRACFSWLGNMKWAVLPLPPQLRESGTAYQDAGYYIYQGSQTGESFRAIWELGARSRKRKAPEAVSA